MSSSVPDAVPDDDALRRQFYAARDIRSLYPRVTENHLRYLEKWGLIRPAAHSTTDRFYTFSHLSTIKQLAGELERSVPLKTALRTLMAEHQGQLQLDFHASGTSPAKVVALQGRPARKPPPDRAGQPTVAGNAFPFSDPQAALDWYQQAFGGQRERFAGLIPGIRYGDMWLLVKKVQEPQAATKGRAIDHLSWGYADLDDAATQLEALGVKFEAKPYAFGSGKIAFVLDPNGVRIELVGPAAKKK